jgi:uncharacterized protein YndB with AHSA1/START domain
MKFVKWMFGFIGGLVALVAVIALIGSLLPQKHSATRSARFRQPPEALWQVITDRPGQTAWRPEVRIVELLFDRDGHAMWRDVDAHGQAVTFEAVVSEPPHRLVVRIADTGLPFGGTWTYELVPADGGSTVTITEDGEIYNPVFRFLARFVFGYTSTMEGYLEALGRKFDEQVTPGPRA